MARPARSARDGRAPLLAAVVLFLLVSGTALVVWMLRPAGVREAAPASDAAARQEPGESELRPPERGEEGPGSSAVTRREGVTSDDLAGVSRLSWSGTVRDAWSGSALADARVVLVGAGREQAATTGADGRFALDWPADLGAGLFIEHAAYVDVRAPSVDLTREGDFSLERSATLRGYVDPAPGSGEGRVMAWLEAASSQRFWEELEAAVSSAGEFELTDLDPGDYVVTALVPGRCVAPQAGLHLERGETLEVVLRAEPAASVAGMVLRMPQGRGVEGVRVSAEPRDDDLPREWSRSVRAETLSDARGRYALEGLGPGRWRVEAQAPWGVQARRDVDVPGSGERMELDLELPGPARLSGRVADAAGRGVEGARVLGVTGNRLRGLDRLAAGTELPGALSTRSGPSGAFALDEVPAQSDLVLVAVAPAPGGDGASRLGIARVGRLEADEVRGGIELVLVEPSTARGIVVGTGGEAIAGATVEAIGRPGGVRADMAQTQSGADGRFELAGLPAGEMLLRAQHPEWLESWTTVDPAAQPGEVEIRMQPAYVLEGIALDTQGFGVSNLPVGIEPSGEARQEERWRSRRRWRGARTDAYGRFRIEGLSEGSWTVRGSSYEWQQLDAQPAVVLTPGDSFVTLTFEPRQRPLRAEIRGELALTDGGTPSGVRIEGLRGGVLAVDRGEFRATGLVPTRHNLTLRAAGHAAVRTGPIDLQPGQVHDLGRIVLEPATVLVVRVRDGEGRPVDGARVRLVPLPLAQGGVGEGGGALGLRNRGRGRYFTADATRHDWRLIVDRDGFRRSARNLKIGPGDRQDITVELKRRPTGG